LPPYGCAAGRSPRTTLDPVDKKALSERDICTKYITPAIAKGGWDAQVQVRENVHLTKGRVIVRGRLVPRGTAKFADSVPYAKLNADIRSRSSRPRSST
jgi:type I restriction enzyme, R subunit